VPAPQLLLPQQQPLWQLLLLGGRQCSLCCGLGGSCCAAGLQHSLHLLQQCCCTAGVSIRTMRALPCLRLLR
jgi:hypothetical protein